MSPLSQNSIIAVVEIERNLSEDQSDTKKVAARHKLVEVYPFLSTSNIESEMLLCQLISIGFKHIPKLLVSMDIDINGRSCSAPTLQQLLNRKRYDLCEFSLELGADINIPITFHDHAEVTPLTYALLVNHDISGCHFLVKHGANTLTTNHLENFLIADDYLKECHFLIDHFKTNNIPLKNSLHSLAMGNGDLDTAKILLDSKLVNPMQQDNHGMTALMIAIGRKHWKLAMFLIANMDDIDAISHTRESALSAAIYSGNFEIERQLRKKLKHPLPKDIDANTPISEYKKAVKHNIIKKGPLTLFQSEQQRNPGKLIESSIYCADNNLGRYLKGKFEILYKEANEYRSIMNVMALAVQGKHDSGIDSNGKKTFKIVCVDNEDYQKLSIAVRGESYGRYTGHNTAFAVLHPLLYQTVGTIMHESVHFVMQEVFKSQSKPYATDDIESRKQCVEMIDKVKERLTSMPKEKQYEQYAHDVISNVFTEYSCAQYPAEIIVRPLQIIATLGYTLGRQWLDENTPELLQYFENFVLPKIDDYSKRHGVSRYIDTISYKLKKTPKNHNIALLRLVEKGMLDDVIMHLENGVEIDDNTLNLCLTQAARQGHLQIIKLLISDEQNWNLPTEIKIKILYHLAQHDHAQPLKALMYDFRDILPDDFTTICFEKAALFGANTVVEFFLKNSPDKISAASRSNAMLSTFRGQHHATAQIIWTDSKKTFDMPTLAQLAKASMYHYAPLTKVILDTVEARVQQERPGVLETIKDPATKK